MRSDQDGIDVKIDIDGKVLIMCGERKSMEKFGVKGISGGGLRCLTSKGGESIIGAKSRLGLTSTPLIDTGGIEVRL